MAIIVIQEECSWYSLKVEAGFHIYFMVRSNKTGHLSKCTRNISLEGNMIFEKVKRLYKLFCICKARNLQRSWVLSLVNVKGLMMSAYFTKLEKYRCTQMSLRSGYELHLCHNHRFSKHFQIHLLQHSPPLSSLSLSSYSQDLPTPLHTYTNKSSSESLRVGTSINFVRYLSDKH